MTTEEYISLEEAKKYHDLDRLPSDTSGNIRIVKISSYLVLTLAIF